MEYRENSEHRCSPVFIRATYDYNGTVAYGRRTDTKKRRRALREHRSFALAPLSRFSKRTTGDGQCATLRVDMAGRWPESAGQMDLTISDRRLMIAEADAGGRKRGGRLLTAPDSSNIWRVHRSRLAEPVVNRRTVVDRGGREERKYRKTIIVVISSYKQAARRRRRLFAAVDRD